MSVAILGGTSGVEADVDSSTKALKVIQLASDGVVQEPKATYRAATTARFAAAAGTAPFFLIYGSATKTIRIQRIRVCAPVLTAVQYLGINVAKYSTASSGGTATALTQTPTDSSVAAATASLCSVYTAAPTAGTKVGDLASRALLGQATTAAAGGIPQDCEFDFRTILSQEEIYLRGTTQGVGVYFNAAPASAVTISVEVEWTEE